MVLAWKANNEFQAEWILVEVICSCLPRVEPTIVAFFSQWLIWQCMEVPCAQMNTHWSPRSGILVTVCCMAVSWCGTLNRWGMPMKGKNVALIIQLSWILNCQIWDLFAEAKGNLQCRPEHLVNIFFGAWVNTRPSDSPSLSLKAETMNEMHWYLLRLPNPAIREAYRMALRDFRELLDSSRLGSTQLACQWER